MLAVVDHDEELALAQRGGQHRQRVPVGGQRDVQRGGHPATDLAAVGLLLQADPEHAVRPRPGRRPAQAHRQPGLTAPAGPGQGQDPPGRHRLAGRRQLLGPAHERRQLCRNMTDIRHRPKYASK
ncbi:hypothetical protein ACIBK9_35625 [Nonomuraea sp. NPDC050227]|uniref:hypothetical protein n=1 Tax=Nonomuraea sp. NPDC050227 TaxID=3364360 RepID=UPI0037A355FF